MNCVAELEGVRDIIRGGAGYERQRRVATAAGALPPLVTEDEVREREAELGGRSPWAAAVDLAVREMAADRPLEG